MLPKLKQTIKHSVIYSLGNLSSKLVGLILLPLYTKYLSTSEYGILAILEVTSQILTLFLGLNLGTALLRWCSTEKEEYKRKSIVFTITLTSLVISLISLGILLPFSTEFSTLFFDHANYSNYFTILFISSAFAIINLIPLSLMRVNEKSVFFFLTTSAKFTIILLFNVYFVAFLNLGVEGIIYGQLIGQVLFSLITLPYLVKNLTPKFEFPILRAMINYSFPLVFSSLFTLIMSMGDRYILKFLGSLSDVGIYSLASKISTFINVFIINSFQLGFLPLAFKYAEQRDSKRFFSKVQTYFAFFLVLTALGLSLFSLEIVKTFTSEHSYWEAYTLVPIINLALVFKGMEYVFSITFHQMKVTRYSAIIVSVSMVVSIGLNFLLIPFLGMYGSAISIFITYFLMSFLSWFYSRKLNFIPYELKKILMLIGIYVVFIGMSFLFINQLSTLPRILIKLSLLFSFPLLLYYLDFYEQIELRRLKQSWEKWRNPKRWKKRKEN